MKLSFFTTKNTAVGRGFSKPSITIKDNGNISFSTALMEALALADKKIAFAQDEDSKQDWYLVTNHPDGFFLAKKKGKVNYTFSCKKVVMEIINSVKGFPEMEGTIRIPVSLVASEENVFALITKAADDVKRKIK